MKHSFYSPTKMIIEENAVINNFSALCSLGTKAMLVTSRSAAKVTGALDDVIAALDKGGLPYVVFSEITPNPLYETVQKAAEIAKSEGCDFFIGIGGGSPLDAAKAISLLCANPGITESNVYACEFTNDPFPIAAVGTTAGTGSEVTRYSVITNSAGMKQTIRSDKLLPAISFGDVRYLKHMSADVIKSTALDAMCHAFESYFNQKADDFSATMAVRALKLLIPEFETISAYGTDGLDSEDFTNLYLASIYSGYAIQTTGTAMCHALSYYLSEEFSIPHGYACAVYLPAFLMHSSKWAPEKAALLYDELCRTEEELRTLATDLTAVREIHFSKQNFDAMRPRLKNNGSLSKCLGETSPEYFEEIIKALFM